MTAWQEVVSKLEDGGRESASGPATWDDAPAPAQLARRVLKGVFRRDPPAERIPLLTNAMHWGYGTAWGGIYGLVQGTLRTHPAALGLVFGSGVWAASYVGLVPMGLYEPPWKYPAKTLAKDISYHAVYGLGVAAAYEAQD